MLSNDNKRKILENSLTRIDANIYQLEVAKKVSERKKDEKLVKGIDCKLEALIIERSVYEEELSGLEGE